MGHWSPMDAMKAYIRTLQLSRDYNSQCNGSNLIEPECMEYISALAAGNQAQLMVHISNNGLSSSTLALAVAAKCTGGRLISLRSDPAVFEDAKAQIECFGLDDVVELKLGDPCEVIRQYKNIDFAVIEHKIEGCVRLFHAMDMNPSRSVVIVCNMFHGGVSYPRVVMKARVRVGMKFKTLPIAGGMEVTNIGSGSSRRRKRTFLVYENCNSKF